MTDDCIDRVPFVVGSTIHPNDLINHDLYPECSTVRELRFGPPFSRFINTDYGAFNSLAVLILNCSFSLFHVVWLA